ncbi:MAG: hypothetical protein RJQ04_09165 [Longimicrobiales bacterium]
MQPVLEAVPNFSEGRDLRAVGALVDLIAGHDGVEVLDWSADPDHHRAVVTYVGHPDDVARASVAAACWARDHIDLTHHDGIHPRVGALDVLPFVPLAGLSMADAVAVSRRVGRALAAEGIPVFYYARSSRPPGRGLAELRRGGVEAFATGFPADRTPDEPAGALAPHPTAGVTCVGARPVLLAWNVYVEGVSHEDARALAASLRERGGGFPGLRALGLHLERQGRLQVSMNLEDPARTSPMDVFRAIEAGVGARGGRVTGTEVIGMLPDALVLPAAGDRLHLPDLGPARVLSTRVSQHLLTRVERDAEALRHALTDAGERVPVGVREAALRVIGGPRGTPTADDDS